MKQHVLYLLLFIVTLNTPYSVCAQYYSVNIDTKTVAAMVGAYATETAAEALYNEQVKTILSIIRLQKLLQPAYLHPNIWIEKPSLT